MGSGCAVCGVLVMALPIPIVVDNFADYYKEQKKLEAKELRNEELAREAVMEGRAMAVARRGLLETLTRGPGPFSSPPSSPGDSAAKVRNGDLAHNDF